MKTSLIATISIIAGLLMIAAIACGSSPASPAPTKTPREMLENAQAELDRHRTRWEANRSGDYTFEYRPVCFCVREFVQPVQVKVRNGVVESVTYIESGESAATNGFPLYDTIDGLLDMIQDAIDRKAARLTVSYDPEIGYPTSVSIDYALNIADEEFSFTATSYEPLDSAPTESNAQSSPMPVYDYRSLIADLASAGATVEELDPSVSPVGFSVGKGPRVAVNGGTIQVYEFPDEHAADTEAGYVSPDGYTVTVPLGGDRNVSTHSDWLAPPHYYKKGRVIVRYVGDSMAVLEALEAVLGPQFAGSQER